MNGVIALAGGLSIPVGAALLALTALPGLRRPRRIAPLLALQGVLAAGVLGLGAVALAFPSIVPMVPKAGSPPRSPCSCSGSAACWSSPTAPCGRTR